MDSDNSESIHNALDIEVQAPLTPSIDFVNALKI
jgi:hypothetical protein